MREASLRSFRGANPRRMDGKADLHLHTLYSDGALPPRDLLEQARLAGLTTISITDHDNTGGLQEAQAQGALLGIEVIPGVELSTSVNGQDIHLLGYFFDSGDRILQEYLALFRTERHHRAERIVRRLNELKIPLSFEAVISRAGGGSIGRPHIATALVEEGFIESYQEAFARYLGFGRPAYERKYQITPREAVRLLAEAGGLSFIAHPGNAIDERVLLGAPAGGALVVKHDEFLRVAEVRDVGPAVAVEVGHHQRGDALF